MPNPAPGFERHPDHRIVVEPYPGTVTVRFGDTVVASSKQALELREASYPPVLYIPLEDIYLEHFEKSATTTHCPFKGDAAYWNVSAQGEAADWLAHRPAPTILHRPRRASWPARPASPQSGWQ